MPSSGGRDNKRRFTWRGPQIEGYSRLFQKLDRMLCNVNWRIKFREARMRILIRYASNHRPILIQFFSDSQDKNNRPFYFEVTWISHTKIEKFIQENWRKESSVVEAIKDVATAFLEWNNSVFRHIKKRKNKLVAKIR